MEDMLAQDKKASLWTKDFFMTTLSNLFLFFSFQMLLPTLPAYIEQYGGDEVAVGLVIALFTISAIITRLFAGRALDTISKRKILMIGLMIFIASVFSYNWTTTVLFILSLRTIHGVGWGITSTSFGTIISDIVPAKRRGEGMGYYGLSSTLAMAAAPTLGIWLMKSKGFHTLFYISTILAVITLLLSLTIRLSQSKKESNTPPKTQGLENYFEKRALFPSFIVMLFSFTYGGIVSFITLFGKEVNIENVGLFFMANAIMVMVTRPISGVIFDKKGHKWVLIPGAFFAGVGLLLLSYTTNTTMLITSAIFYGIGFGVIQPSLMAWTINRVAPNRKGVANGNFFSAFDLGIAIGSIVFGFIAKFTTYAVMYRSSVLVLVIYLVVYLFYLRREKVEN